MKILVTGGAGYKGILLTSELLNRGHEVTIVDNFMYGYNSVLHLAGKRKLTVLKMDVRSIGERDLSNFDAIFHLAAIVGMPACNANQFGAQTVNVDATRRITGLLSPGQALIYASTTSFYGSEGAECDESSAVHPVSLYARTKYSAEQIVMEREHSVSLRFATVFGISPRMRTELLVNDFTYKVCKDKVLILYSADSRRTFLHIDDAIYGYVFALDNFGKMKSHIYNVGEETLNLSKIEIAQVLKRHQEFELIFGSMQDMDVRNFVVSFSKIKELGYRAKRNLDEGIRDMIRLYSYYDDYTPFRAF